MLGRLPHRLVLFAVARNSVGPPSADGSKRKHFGVGMWKKLLRELCRFSLRAGTTAQTCVFPFDTIRRRLQASPRSGRRAHITNAEPSPQRSVIPHCAPHCEPALPDEMACSKCLHAGVWVGSLNLRQVSFTVVAVSCHIFCLEALFKVRIEP